MAWKSEKRRRECSSLRVEKPHSTSLRQESTILLPGCIPVLFFPSSSSAALTTGMAAPSPNTQEFGDESRWQLVRGVDDFEFGADHYVWSSLPDWERVKLFTSETVCDFYICAPCLAYHSLSQSQRVTWLHFENTIFIVKSAMCPSPMTKDGDGGGGLWSMSHGCKVLHFSLASQLDLTVSHKVLQLVEPKKKPS